MSKTTMGGARIKIGGRPVFEVLSIGLPSGETIIFPRIAGFGKHLSLYFPSPGRKIARQITHHYPAGRKRHTRRKTVSSGKLVRDFLAALAPGGDPPPLASIDSAAARPRWETWLGRAIPKMIRKPEDRSIWVPREPFRKLFERVTSGG